MTKKSIFISSPTRDQLGEYRARLVDLMEKVFEFNVVISEGGGVDYGAGPTREIDCINSIDDDSITIFISIITMEFGSTSDNDRNHSISMQEFIEARKRKKIIYVLVNKKVKDIYDTYKGNNFSYSSVEHTKIEEKILIFLKKHIYEPESYKRLIIIHYDHFDEAIKLLKRQFCTKLHSATKLEYQKKQSTFATLAEQVMNPSELTPEGLNDFILQLLKISNFTYSEIIQKNDFLIILSEITAICSKLLKSNDGSYNESHNKIVKNQLKDELDKLIIKLIKMDIKQ